MNYKILHERPADDSLIEPLLDRCFGFDRHHKTVYRLREGVAPIAELSFVAVASGDGLLGSLRFWPVRIGEAAAILLGPLAVEPALQGAGIGRGLLRHGLIQAKYQDAKICVVPQGCPWRRRDKPKNRRATNSSKSHRTRQTYRSARQ